MFVLSHGNFQMLSTILFNPFPNNKFSTFPNSKTLQITILDLIKMEESSPKGLNTLGESRNCMLQQFFLLPVFSKDL